jgi:DNA-binding ferritin-like protein
MEIILPMLQFQSQLKAWHWLTRSFSQHKAFGDAYDALSESVDTFVETYFGRYGRETAGGFVLNIKAETDPKTVQALIGDFKQYLSNMDKEIRDGSDLLNIRDEILGEVDHLIYMLTFQ